MAEKIKLMEDFLTCSVCLETFKEPVSLGCNHSFCLSCVQDFWDKNQTRNCPVCKRRNSKDLAINFALNELCKSFTEKLETGESTKPKTTEEKKNEGATSSGATSSGVISMSVQPLLQQFQKQLQEQLQSLRAEKQSYSDLEKIYTDMFQFNKDQVVVSGRQIKAEFQRLHSFLQEEENRALSALTEEQQTQTQKMKLELQEVREKLETLDKNIRELEKHLQTDSSTTPPQSPAPPRLRPKAGLLLDRAKVLGNLSFRVWRNMRRTVSYSPVLLDPNTAHRWMYLSEDLRGVRWGDTVQEVPDNPERFCEYSEVLGSEGFSSGSHQWDVEVGDHPHWIIGVAKESVERKGECTASPKYGIWALAHRSGKYTNGLSVPVPVQTPVKKLRVKLDCDVGDVSFYDLDHMTLLYTHSDTFTEKLFPYFHVYKAGEAETKEIRILPRDQD